MKFDLDRYLAVVDRLDDSDIDYEAFESSPLDSDTLRCLTYMHDVEHHTACYLRDLLVTRAHAEPEITSFLAMWVFEEYWHGEALAKVLAAHGIAASTDRVGQVRRRVGREQLRTLGFMAASAATTHIVTIAMTWGAVNEWTTQAGYLRLADRSGHPVLADLLRRIARQEGRHIDFYASQAERRLGESRAAQRAVRLALRHKWAPVGSGIMPPAETRHLVDVLFDGPEGEAMARRIDRRIERLPGLDGLGLIARSCGLGADRPASSYASSAGRMSPMAPISRWSA